MVLFHQKKSRYKEKKPVTKVGYQLLQALPSPNPTPFVRGSSVTYKKQANRELRLKGKRMHNAKCGVRQYILIVEDGETRREELVVMMVETKEKK